MRLARTLTGLAVLLVAAGGFATGRLLEASGLADQVVRQAGEEVPGEGGIVPAPEQPPVRPPVDAEQLAGVVEPPADEELYWGLYRPGAPYDDGVIAERTELLGATPAIVMWFQEWAGEPSFPAAEADDLADRGIVPMITWEAWEPPPDDPSVRPTDVREEADQPDFRLQRIADGAFDDYLERYAREVRAYGGPLMLRIFHEFDGFWFPWGGTVNGNQPEDLVDAWRHVHGIFEEAGADNVTWVWSPNTLSVPDTAANELDNYWPGSEFVDWIGLSGFNFGETSDFADFQSFVEIYDHRMEDLAAYEAPVIVAEFASAEEGGDKAEWIRAAFEAMRDRYPVIAAAVWFDRRIGDVRDWRITSTDEALAAFIAAIGGPEVRSAPAAYLTTTDDEPFDVGASPTPDPTITLDTGDGSPTPQRSREP